VQEASRKPGADLDQKKTLRDLAGNLLRRSADRRHNIAPANATSPTLVRFATGLIPDDDGRVSKVIAARRRKVMNPALLEGRSKV
jgi:hypothetical protein